MPTPLPHTRRWNTIIPPKAARIFTIQHGKEDTQRERETKNAQNQKQCTKKPLNVECNTSNGGSTYSMHFINANFNKTLNGNRWIRWNTEGVGGGGRDRQSSGRSIGKNQSTHIQNENNKHQKKILLHKKRNGFSIVLIESPYTLCLCVCVFARFNCSIHCSLSI